MIKKISEEIISSINEAIKNHEIAWENLKKTWGSCEKVEDLDKAFYDYIEAWLKLDSAVDDNLHAHTLPFWEDPDLGGIIERSRKIQMKLSKIGGKKKLKKIREAEEKLEKIISEI